MFDSTNFCTFEVMDGALVHSVTSEQPLHPAEHAIVPLEPNMAWEANEANTQHKIVIILPESREVGGILFIHHESEVIHIAVEFSDNGTSWTAIPVVIPYWGSAPTDPPLISIRYLWNISTFKPVTVTAQFWRITFSGSVAPNYYTPTDMRISACWLFTANEITKRANLPLTEQIVFPKNLQLLPFGKQYVTGQNVNQSRTFSRTWVVTDAQRTELWQVISNCGGAYLPFILFDNETVIPRLCRFNPSAITESLIDIGLTSVTAQLAEIPIVKQDARH